MVTGAALARAFGIPLPAARALAAAANAAGKAVASIRNSGKSLAGIKLDMNNISSAFRSVFSLPSLLIGGTVGLLGASVVQAMAFKESMLTSFGVILDSKKAGAELFKQATAFANVTPFDTNTVVGLYQQMLGAGFKRPELNTVASGVGDLAAMKGFDKETLTRVTSVFAQMKAKPYLQGEEMMQLAEAGIPMVLIQEKLQKLYKVNAVELQKMQKAGKISGDAGVYAALQAIQEFVDKGKPLGTMMQEQSRTITGLLSTVQSIPQGIFNRLVPDDQTLSKGDKAYRGFFALKKLLGNVADNLGEGSPAGNKVMGALSGGINQIMALVLEPLANATTTENLIKTINALFSNLTKFVAWVQTVWPTILGVFQGVSQGVGASFEVFKKIYEFIAPLVARFSGFITKLIGGKAGTQSAAKSFGLVLGFLLPLVLVFNTLAGVVAPVLAVFGFMAQLLGPVILIFGSLARTVLPFLLRQLFFVGGGFLRLAAQGTLMGLRLAAAWVIGLGPIAWGVMAFAALVGALIWAYNHVTWFRDGVNAATTFIGKAWYAAGAWIVDAWSKVKVWFGETMVWFSGLPDKIVGFFLSLPERFAAIGKNIYEALVPKPVRDFLGNAASALRGAANAIGGAATGAWNSLTGGGKDLGGDKNVAKSALEALNATWSEQVPGYCSRFVRQIFEKAVGPSTAGLFGASAVESEKLWKQAGLTRTMEQINKSGGLRPGDVLFQGVGSGGFGHVGVVTQDPTSGKLMVAENSTRNGANVKDGRGLVSLQTFGRITSVGRYGAGGGSSALAAPATTAASTAGRAALTSKPVMNLTVNITGGTGSKETDKQTAESVARVVEETWNKLWGNMLNAQEAG